MKSGYFFIPVLGLFIGFIGSALGASGPDWSFMTAAGWSVAAGLLALWVFLDLQGFKAAFTRKGAKYGASSGLVVILGIAVIVAVAALTSRPRFNKSVDLTRDGVNTLAPQSKKLVEQTAELSEPIKIIGFFSDQQIEQTFRDLTGRYEALGARFAIEYVDPQVDPTRAMAEELTSPNTVIFRNLEAEKRITTFTEERFTNALVNVLKGDEKAIYFISGHGEADITNTEAEGLDMVVTELKNNRNRVENLSLLETAKIPDDADVVVIAGPKYDLKEEELRIIENYLKAGGSLFVMADALTEIPALTTSLEKFGVSLQSDVLLLEPNDIRAQMIGQNNAIVTDFDGFNPVTKDFSESSQVSVVLQSTRSLAEVKENANEMKVTLAAKTANTTMRVTGVTRPRDLQDIGDERLEFGSFPVIAVASGKAQTPATANNDIPTDAGADTAADVATEQDPSPVGKEVRLVVAGSVQFANNMGVRLPENRDLFMNAINYLLQDEDFISISPKDPTKSQLDVSSTFSNVLLSLLVFIYPFGFLGVGFIYWLDRRKA